MPALTKKFAAGLLSVTLLAGLFLAGGPYAGTAHACSCITTSLQDEIKRSDAVFSGTVRSIDEGDIPDGAGGSTAPGVIEATGRVSFDVEDSWKGVAAETVDVYGQGDGANCFNLFEEGEAYVVYASRGGDAGGSASLENNACGGTKPLALAEKDLRVLGPSSEQLTDTGGFATPIRLATAAAVSLAAATAALLIAVRRN